MPQDRNISGTHMLSDLVSKIADNCVNGADWI